MLLSLLSDGGVSAASDDKSVVHCHTVDIRAVTPEEGECFIALKIKFQKGRYKFQIENYFRTPRHSVSSVLVAHNLAVASSLPVTSIEPSSCWFRSTCFRQGQTYREAHAVDALLMVGHRLQQLPLLPPGAPPRPHLQTGLTSTNENHMNQSHFKRYV